MLELGSQAGAPPFETGTPEQARRAYNEGFPDLQGEREPVAALSERIIAGPGGPLTLRIYRGQGAPAAGAPALLYLHGGGWVIGNLDSHDEICRWFANVAGCVVVAVDYRLAPEHKFPAAVEDCRATLAFMQSAAGELGIDAGRIAVAGDSAGGNLATVLGLLARGDNNPPSGAAAVLSQHRCRADGRQLSPLRRRLWPDRLDHGLVPRSLCPRRRRHRRLAHLTAEGGEPRRCAARLHRHRRSRHPRRRRRGLCQAFAGGRRVGRAANTGPARSTASSRWAVTARQRDRRLPPPLPHGEASILPSARFKRTDASPASRRG